MIKLLATLKLAEIYRSINDTKLKSSETGKLFKSGTLVCLCHLAPTTLQFLSKKFYVNVQHQALKSDFNEIFGHWKCKGASLCGHSFCCVVRQIFKCPPTPGDHGVEVW